MNHQERGLRRRLRTLPQVYDEIDLVNAKLNDATEERTAAYCRAKLAILRRMSFDLAQVPLPLEGVAR